MATKQGMCRNCGSLVVFDDRDDTCECVFCHCVFPSEEAVALLENPEGHEFKNEKFEAKEGGKHYFVTQAANGAVSKSPEGMFDSLTIDNDLAFVDQKIREYYDMEGEEKNE